MIKGALTLPKAAIFLNHIDSFRVINLKVILFNLFESVMNTFGKLSSNLLENHLRN